VPPELCPGHRAHATRLRRIYPRPDRGTLLSFKF
jgi:hypothetical protein